MPEEQTKSLAENIMSYLGPSEAEASPVSNIIKAGAKALAKAKLPPSRTAEKLIGTEFKGGVIKNVTKGTGNWRNVVLQDDSVYPVTKDVLSSMMRQQGTVGKMAELESKKLPVAMKLGSVNPAGPSGGQIDQALTSMAYHESRANPYLPRKTIRDNYKDYIRQVKETGAGIAVPYSLVQRGTLMYSMPTPYAQLLEKEGHLKIIGELK